MNLQETKIVSFPKETFEDWAKRAEQSLKGKPLADLSTATYEGITLNPLYTASSTSIEEEWPGFAPFTRGTSILGFKEQPWFVSQAIPGDNSKKIINNFKDASSRGQNIIALTFSQLATMKEEELLNFFQYVMENHLPIFIDSKGGQKAILAQLKKLSPENKSKLKGILAEDPISEGVIHGKGIDSPDEFFSTWFDNVRSSSTSMPEVKTILVKSTAVHDAGGNAVQELAMALAIAAEYLHYGSKNGCSAETIAKQMVFSFSVDSAFFMNVAKLRAARRLWSLIGQEYSDSVDSFKMFIHCETSSFTETLFDPYVNLLRAGNQAFAALIGGAQSLEVKEFNSATNESTAFSKRIARNIHLVLKEETLIDKIVDPSGGSYYVEAITNELAEKAWDLFLEIEKQGGALNVLNSGWIQTKVNETLKQKKENVALRKDSLIGTNVYPNLDDQIHISNKKSLEVALPYKVKKILPLTAVRLAEEFEELRIASLRHKEKLGSYPTVGLICLRDLKSYKPRADFVKGFMAAGGVEVKEYACQTIDEALAFVKQENHQHYILCGNDRDYQEVSLSWTEKLVEVEGRASFYMAGKQKRDFEELLIQAGIKEFISVQSNAITFISSILKDLEVM